MKKIKKWEWIVLLTVVFLFLFLVCCSYQEDVDVHRFEKLSLIFLLFVFVLLFSDNFRFLAVLFLLFLSFTLWFYLVLACYSYYPAMFGDFKMWNDSMKDLTQSFWNVEVVGRQNYQQAVIFAPLQSHGTGITDFLAFSYLSENLKVVLKKLSDHHPGYLVTRNDCIFVGYKKNGAEKGGNFEQVMKKSTKYLKRGYDLVIFPEGRYARKKYHNLKEWRFLAPLQTGCFYLAKKNQTKIVPVITEKYRCPVYLISPGIFRIHLLEPIVPTGKTIKQLKNEYQQKIEEKLKTLHKNDDQHQFV